MSERDGDDWDSSSPSGSPSSSLPQSIRDVLERVRAECSARALGDFGSSSVKKPSNVTGPTISHEKHLSGSAFRTDPSKETMTVCDEMETDVDNVQVTSHSSNKQKNDVAKQLKVNPAFEGRKNTEQLRASIASQTGTAKVLKPAFQAQKVESQTLLGECPIRKEQNNVSTILAGYQYTRGKNTHWIKIDSLLNKKINHKNTEAASKKPAHDTNATPEKQKWVAVTELTGNLRRDKSASTTPTSTTKDNSENLENESQTQILGFTDTTGRSVELLDSKHNEYEEAKFTKMEKDYSNSIIEIFDDELDMLELDFTFDNVESNENEAQGSTSINSKFQNYKPNYEINGSWENAGVDVIDNNREKSSDEEESIKHELTEHDETSKAVLDPTLTSLKADEEESIKHELTEHDETSKAVLEPTLTSLKAIWRRELLTSDFSLMYGNLRAVLMRNISNSSRHRLIQTMIATMGEIEEVIMGEGNPVQRSVRCETPEQPTTHSEEEEAEEEEGQEEPGEAENEDTSENDSRTRFEEGQDSNRISFLRKREKMLNLKRREMLTKKDSSGTLVCLVCLKPVCSWARCCRACAAFTWRVEKNYTIGAPLPTCHHINYQGGANCKSCRFRMFSFLSMTAKSTRVRQVKPKKCPICKKKNFHLRGWKCMQCCKFVSNLRRKKETNFPSCNHSGKFPSACDGCRLHSLQEEWDRREKKGTYPFPLIKNLP